MLIALCDILDEPEIKIYIISHLFKVPASHFGSFVTLEQPF